jgi:hypothetical protein
MTGKVNWALVLILSVAVLLRVVGLNWDSGAHLHPDERFLTMVVSSMKMPSSVQAYFDPSVSPMNPSNLQFPFFVYGTFPLTLIYLISRVFGTADYMGALVVGRSVSVFLDITLVLGVYVLARQLYGVKDKQSPLWAAGAYTLTVFAIQQAHFFTVDIVAAVGMLWGIIFSLWYVQKPRIGMAMLLSLCVALAVASKITSLMVVPLIGYFFLLSFYYHKEKRPTIFIQAVLSGLFLLAMTRIANPYYFSQLSWFDWTISPSFMSSLTQLQLLSTSDAAFPPAVQWITKVPILFPLQQIVMVGCGIVLSCLAVWGVLSLVMYGSWSKKSTTLWCGVALALWSGAFFMYYGIRFAKTMRYFYILYPLIAVVAGYGASHWATLWWKKALLIGLLCLWPVSFVAIYQEPHSRVAASRWMLENIPTGSRVSYEHWDDALPVQAEGLRPGPYEYEELAVFAPDTNEKWEVLGKQLASLDYLVLSSNRGYGSIMSVPNRYPRMSAWYASLFAGRTPYVKVAEFTSYPRLCLPGGLLGGSRCWEFPDQWAEEAFTVYDHPVVMIYKRIP